MHTRKIGSRAEVWHGSCEKTSGGLKKKDLMKTKSGRIVSRRKHASGKKAISRLFKLGYKPKKGTFKLFKKEKKSRRSTRRRGGNYEDAAAMADKLFGSGSGSSGAAGSK